MSIQRAVLVSRDSPSIHADDEDGVWLMVAEGHHVLDAFTQAKFGKRAILPEISWHETCSKYSSSRHHLYIYIKKKCRNDTFYLQSI